MIGGLFKPASVASIAATGLLLGGVSAQAADLGGNCCADLEERVAELEATTARKGNRKVSLEVSGHVNEAVLFWDDGRDQDVYIVTNNQSRTRFRFKGAAQITADWSAGFLLEMGLRQTGDSSGANQFTTDKTTLDIRHQALYLKSQTFGTVWLGHTQTAVDGIADICLGCTMNNSHEMSLAWGGFYTRDKGNPAYFGPSWSDLGAGNNVASGASRRQLLRYVSPTVAGFVFSADWGGSENIYNGDSWSVALRYAAEFNSIRIAGGIGYYDERNLKGDYPDGVEYFDDVYSRGRGWGGSLSLQHTPTGLFIAGSYGTQDDKDEIAVGERLPANLALADETSGWSVTAGIGQRWMSLGRTTFWGRYGEYRSRGISNACATLVDPAEDLECNDAVDTGAVLFDVPKADTRVWAIGLNQSIDAAAMDLYVTYYTVSGTVEYDNTVPGDAFGSISPEDFQAIMTGAIIRF